MRFILFILIGLLFSCKGGGSKTGDMQNDSLQAEEKISPESKLIWITDYDTLSGEFFLKQQRTINADSLTAERVIASINAAWEDIVIVFNKLSNDTLYVSIPESEFLTQRMGSAGAEGYLASTTYNLTEVKGIKFVNYNFEEGDHLSPGVYSREDFEKYH